MPDRGWIKVVSPEWVNTIAQRQPAVVNVWQTAYNSWVRVQPGDLVLLKRRGSVEDIIGFGTVYARFPAWSSTTWERYRFGSGALDENDLLEQVLRRRTGQVVDDPVIGNIVIHDLVLFRDRPFKLHQQSAIPVGHYPWASISASVCEQLAGQLSAHASTKQIDEASVSASSGHEKDARVNAWEDKVKAAYRWCCAVSPIRARDLLRVVRIQPDGPLDASNGLLLELDRAKLYEEGLIAFHTNGALLVSPDLALQDRPLYRRLAGEPLKLPKSSEDQPAPDLIEWRLNHVYKR